MGKEEKEKNRKPSEGNPSIPPGKEEKAGPSVFRCKREKKKG